MPADDPDQHHDLATIERQKVQKPRMYRVLLHNDDYTPMEFVTWVPESIFHKDAGEAVRIMLAVHRQGIGQAGIYTREVAESKVAQVTELAQRNEHPLKCTMEPE